MCYRAIYDNSCVRLLLPYTYLPMFGLTTYGHMWCIHRYVGRLMWTYHFLSRLLGLLDCSFASVLMVEGNQSVTGNEPGLWNYFLQILPNLQFFCSITEAKTKTKDLFLNFAPKLKQHDVMNRTLSLFSPSRHTASLRISKSRRGNHLASLY